MDCLKQTTLPALLRWPIPAQAKQAEPTPADSDAQPCRKDFVSVVVSVRLMW